MLLSVFLVRVCHGCLGVVVCDSRFDVVVCLCCLCVVCTCLFCVWCGLFVLSLMFVFGLYVLSLMFLCVCVVCVWFACVVLCVGCFWRLSLLVRVLSASVVYFLRCLDHVASCVECFLSLLLVLFALLLLSFASGVVCFRCCRN